VSSLTARKQQFNANAKISWSPPLLTHQSSKFAIPLFHDVRDFYIPTRYAYGGSQVTTFTQTVTRGHNQPKVFQKA